MKKIAVVTGSRAEYGLLAPLLKEICSDKRLQLQLVVTGMHLSPDFGLTYREIVKDGFQINEKVKIPLDSDASVGIAQAVGTAIMKLSKSYTRLEPELIVILGDRFEIFAAAAAAVILKIPVAHIHGGEITEGSIDDTLRHCITKMSHLHFTATEEYRKRVIQLGESPGTVFNVGAIGLDNIKSLKFLSREEMVKQLNIRFAKRNLLVTFHPATIENNTAEQFNNLLKVFDILKETNVIFTKANADSGGRIINKMIDKYVRKNPSKTNSFTSMGRIPYLSLMRMVDAVVGNSSSGIIEAPSFHVPTVNIGSRQDGRIKAKSVIDCKPEKEHILKAIKKAISNEFKQCIKNVKNPYGSGNTAKRIKEILANFQFGDTKKKFYDIKRDVN